MWFIDPYRLDTIQVYLPESAGTRSRSFRYQSEVLTVAPIIYFRYQRDVSAFASLSRFFKSFPSFNHLHQREELTYGLKRRFFMFFPSFNHLYLSGGAPIAWHFSRMECDAGHALNDLFSKFGSLNIGAPAKVQKQKQKQNNKARTYRWTEWMND